jgi:hypothetical protein
MNSTATTVGRRLRPVRRRTTREPCEGCAYLGAAALELADLLGPAAGPVHRRTALGGGPPADSSWLNRIEAQFTALRNFALDGTDHASHKEQGSMIRRYIVWRNKHAADERLREGVDRANIA